MIKLVPIQTTGEVDVDVAEAIPSTVGELSGPSTISRSTTYRGARRAAPRPRMWLLSLTAEAPADEVEADLQGETLPIIFA